MFCFFTDVKRLRSDGTDPNDDTDDTDDTDSDDRRRRRRAKKSIALAVRYAKDWRGQPIRSIFPAAVSATRSPFHTQIPNHHPITDQLHPIPDQPPPTNTVSSSRRSGRTVPVRRTNPGVRRSMRHHHLLHHVRRVEAATGEPLQAVRLLHGTFRPPLPGAGYVYFN